MNIGSWIDFDSISGWTIVWLLVTAVATWLAARYGRKAVARLLARIDGLSTDYSVTAARLAGYLIALLGIGTGLTILGANVQPLLILVLIVGVAAFLALRGVADNFGASLILQTRKPAHIGDLVESLGYLGTVVELNGRSVVLRTFDGHLVHLPNGKVLAEPLVNRSSPTGNRSMIEVRTTELKRVDELRDVLLGAVRHTNGVRTDPPPDLVWVGSSPDRLVGRLRVWHAPPEDTAAISAIVLAASEALRDAGLAVTLLAPPPPPPFTPPPAL
ncbi:MAG TPA: mechanosensitive ion channel domain-containing protein [Luteimicrobium sp.]|jgi:small-conductance mechanosensitive channel|nr:mechanosensitive ion channel domain-containing protein [Luteimicrobium sp.]